MDHEGEMEFNRPSHLFFEGQKLFLFELPAPVEVKANLANGNGKRVPAVAPIPANGPTRCLSRSH